MFYSRFGHPCSLQYRPQGCRSVDIVDMFVLVSDLNIFVLSFYPDRRCSICGLRTWKNVKSCSEFLRSASSAVAIRARCIVFHSTCTNTLVRYPFAWTRAHIKSQSLNECFCEAVCNPAWFINENKNKLPNVVLSWSILAILSFTHVCYFLTCDVSLSPTCSHDHARNGGMFSKHAGAAWSPTFWAWIKFRTRIFCFVFRWYL